MLTIDEAFTAYRENIEPIAASEVAVGDATGWVLAEPARAVVDLPPFEQSAMDGYAVRAAEIADGARLPVALTVPARGHEVVPTLPTGACARIFTGGHVPAGADTVIMQEDVERDGEDAVFARAPVAGANVRHRGEELRAGDPICPAGARLTTGRIGALAAAGVARVNARRPPRAVVLVTGDEVIAPGTPLLPGQVYDCNTPMVLGWLRALGLEATAERLPDDPDVSARMVGDALDRADLVITTGGVSVGDKDYVIGAANRAGVRDVFWKVAQKPGKPLYFGVRDDAVLLGLPGNPAAVFVGLTTHVRHVLAALAGTEPPNPERGVYAGTAPSTRGRDVWLRCVARSDADGRTVLGPLGRQASHMLSNLAEANAVARLPADVGGSESPVLEFYRI